MSAPFDNGLVARYLANANSNRDRPVITVLRIGAEQTAVAFYRSEAEPAATIDLKIGTVRTSSDHFGCYPPTPVGLENAIMVVEDEVARARTVIAEDSVLVTDDASVREIARVAGLDDQAVIVLHLEVVERTFDRLVAASLGRPEPGLPERPSFAATLLILREFMHHLTYSSISIVQ